MYPFQEYWHNLGYLLAAAPTNEVENQNWCAILIWDQFLIKFLAIRSSSSSSLSSQGFYVFTKLMWEILQSIEWLVRNSAQGGLRYSPGGGGALICAKGNLEQNKCSG